MAACTLTLFSLSSHKGNKNHGLHIKVTSYAFFFSFTWRLLASCFVTMKGLVWYLRREGHVLNSHVIFCFFAIGMVYVLLELTVLEAYYKVAFGLALRVTDGLWCRIL